MQIRTISEKGSMLGMLATKACGGHRMRSGNKYAWRSKRGNPCKILSNARDRDGGVRVGGQERVTMTWIRQVRPGDTHLEGGPGAHQMGSDGERDHSSGGYASSVPPSPLVTLPGRLIRRLTSRLRVLFLPEGFPTSVTPDYLPYQIWSIPTHITVRHACPNDALKLYVALRQT